MSVAGWNDRPAPEFTQGEAGAPNAAAVELDCLHSVCLDHRQAALKLLPEGVDLTDHRYA